VETSEPRPPLWGWLCGTETAPNRSTKNQQPTGEFGEFLERPMRHNFFNGVFPTTWAVEKKTKSRQYPKSVTFLHTFPF
jgi:hypothetical protein